MEPLSKYINMFLRAHQWTLLGRRNLVYTLISCHSKIYLNIIIPNTHLYYFFAVTFLSLVRGGGKLIHYHWAQFVLVSSDITALYLMYFVSSVYLKTKIKPPSVISYTYLIQAVDSATEECPSDNTIPLSWPILSN